MAAKYSERLKQIRLLAQRGPEDETLQAVRHLINSPPINHEETADLASLRAAFEQKLDHARTPRTNPAEVAKDLRAAIWLNRTEYLKALIQFQHPSPETLQEALAEAISVGGPRVIETLARYATDPAKALQQAKPTNLLPTIESLLRGTQSPHQRHEVTAVAIQIAARTGNHQVLRAAITRARPDQGQLQTALNQAAKHNQPDTALTLVQHGANPYGDNQEPLRAFIAAGNPKSALALVGNANFPDSPTIYAIRRLFDEAGPQYGAQFLNELLVAASRQHNLEPDDQTRKISSLVNSGANPHYHQDAPFTAACQAGNPAAMRTLLNFAKPQTIQHTKALYEMARGIVNDAATRWFTPRITEFLLNRVRDTAPEQTLAMAH